jgi:hypothetical protein
MGGMFAVIKVRNDLPSGEYTDPGWYEHPKGTVAWKFGGDVPEPTRQQFKATPEQETE